MSEQYSRFCWLLGRVVLVSVCFVLPGLLLVGCQSDSVNALLELNENFYGWRALVEPDEPFDVWLEGNGVYPEAEWRIVEMDSEIIKLRDTEHIPGPHVSAPSLAGPGPFLSHTGHSFTGGTLGESRLVLEIEVDGQVVDRYQVTVEVVEDACDRPEDAIEIGIISANRCGG